MEIFRHPERCVQPTLSGLAADWARHAVPLPGPWNRTTNAGRTTEERRISFRSVEWLFPNDDECMTITLIMAKH